MQLFLLLALSLFVAADYHQDALWEGSNFFSNFNFVNAPDPTHGYVDFVSKDEAYSSGLVRDSSSPVYMGADHTNVASGSGRKSVRLESHTTWTVSPGSSTYLFVLDLQHMPTGCGTWPAWWFFGPNWPANGEIDIVEGVHTQTFTQTTLHTSAGCGMGGQAGNWLSTVCESGGSNNAGCGQAGPGNSYGAPFNAHGGGVYAALWEHDRIAAFYFPRGGVPSDLARGSTTANPNSWGAPFATFPLGGNCPYNHFAQQAMTFDLTFCGDWAGATFGSACPGLGSCASYVQNNPGAFSEAYWSINFIKIFSQPNGQSSVPAPSTVSPVNVPPVANNNGGNVPTGGNPPSGGSNGCTCQAKSGADQGLLQQALDWACGQVDCSAINPGGAQYNPNTLQAHASYAFNAYYQRHSGDSGSCNFNGAAQPVCSSNPSPSPGGSSGGSGCTCSAKSGASASALQAGLDWACGQVDCGPINPGGAQYNPNTLQAHASYAYNAYFQKHSSDSGACDFSGTAQKTCGSSNPPPPPPTGGSSGGSGCTCQAKSGASASALQAGLDWACGQVDCGPINPGGAQYNPNTLQAHASYAYNAWYLKNNRNSGACDFSGTAQTVCGSSNPPPPPPTGGSSSSGCTCQAKSGANAGTLQGALDWACGQVDCSPINPGGAQYNPNTLQAHASYAFNAYFQKHSSDSGACDFSGTAQKVCGSSNPPPVARGCTCSAKSNANTGTLQGALDWVCGQVNCAAINPGGANFNPNTLQAHASWAFNAYYQAHSSQGAGACDFSGTASLSCSGSRESSVASDNAGLSNGEIVGIVVGCVIGAALVVLVVVVVYTRTVGRGDSV